MWYKGYTIKEEPNGCRVYYGVFYCCGFFTSVERAKRAIDNGAI